MRPGNWRLAGAGASRPCRSWRRDSQRLEALQSLLELAAHGRKIAGQRRLSAHQHIIEVGTGFDGNDHARYFAQPAADPVAGNRVANLAAYGESHPNALGLALFGRKGRNLKHKSGHGTAAPGLDAQEVSTVRQTPEARRGQFC